MNILVPIADGSEEIEFTIIVDVLRRAGANVTTASLMEKKEIIASRAVQIIADELFTNVDTNGFDMIVLPGGGPGSEQMKQSPLLLATLKEFYNTDKWIGAICAAPTVLASIGLLNGKNATCYPSMSAELTNSNYSTDNVVVDGKIITSQGPGTTFEFVLKIVELLISPEISNKTKKELLL
jgi:4-methyl-5(b-hydroxyethyl)-thiazole monophosphate biosynthesis